MESFQLSVWDYFIFFTVLAISASIGVYFRFTGGKQRTVDEYLLADGKMTAIPVAFSLMASFISAITILGVSSEVYNYGTQFLLINFAYVLGTPIVCKVYLPVFYKLKKFSVYEYLEDRFGKTTKVLASLTFLIQMILYTGIVLYAPSLALSAVTGLDKTTTILSVGIVCSFYSTIGGMKAVLFTDVFQSFLMLAAVICVISKGLLDYGGVGRIWTVASEGNRLEFFNFVFDPTHRHTFFTQLIGGTFMYLGLYAVNQAQVQRLLTTGDLRTARLSLWYSLPIMFVVSFATGFAGLVMYTKYRDCDPIKQKRISSADQIMPLFVVDSFQHIPGLTGLFIAGILSGSLSTVSSAINSLAAVTFQDYLQPIFQTRNFKESTISSSTKILAMMFGCLCTILAFVAEQFTGILQASLTIFGLVGGPLLGLFTCGMLLPFTSEITVIPSFLIALVFNLWMGFGRPKPIPMKLHLGTECLRNVSLVSEQSSSSLNGSMSLSETFGTSNVSTAMGADSNEKFFYLYRISYQWYPLIGFTITVTLAAALSLIFRQKKKIEASLLSPVIVKSSEREETFDLSNFNRND